MLDTTYFIAFILVILRVTAFFAALSVLFPDGFPNSVKVAFSVIIAFFIMASVNYSSLNGVNNTFVFAEMCICEVITGLVFGYLTNLAFMCGKIAGQLIDIQVGFSMLTLFDPTTKTSATLSEKLLSMLSVIIFLIINGHHILIKGLADSFNVIGLGKFILGQQSAMFALNVFTQFFTIGFRIALPIILVLLVADIVMGLVSRTVPQLNVMILGLPVKVLFGFSILVFILPVIINQFINAFSMLPDLWKGIYHIIPLALIFATEEKTEEATPKKKSDAKKKGQVSRSKDVGLALSLIVITIIIATLGDFCFGRLKNMMIVFFNGYINKNLTELAIQNVLIFSVINIGVVVLIFALPILVIGVIGNYIQTGFIFTGEPLKPDFKKLSPINGFKKMFSSRTAVDLIKDLFIVTIVGYVGYKFIMDNLNTILQLNVLNFNYIPSSFRALIVNIFFRIALITTIIAIIDYVYQRYMFKKDLRMTKQEVKEEYKQEDGDPQLKAKRKQRMREMASRRMMVSVPDATVVITNPTHLAVAIKYVEGENSAPIVVAKGADKIALKIKEIAKENGVTIIENKPLARLMYEEVEIDQEIPMDMYEAVAEILALVYKMKKR